MSLHQAILKMREVGSLLRPCLPFITSTSAYILTVVVIAVASSVTLIGLEHTIPQSFGNIIALRLGHLR